MFIFWFKEALKLIGRAKSSFLLTLISMSISVLLFTASVISIDVSGSLQNDIKSSVAINIFLKDDISDNRINSLRKDLSLMNAVKAVKYIDKETAAKNFIKETGEDFRKILDYNPLPASFSVTLKNQYVEKDSLNKIIKTLSGIKGVDEVVFQQKFVYRLLDYLARVKKYIFAATLVLILISIYLVYSTIKLIINSKYEEMETMKLVGAKLSTIKMPIILNTVITGFLAGLVGLGIIYLFLNYVDRLISLKRFLTLHDGIYLVVLICAGPVLGFLVSIFSLRKLTLKI